MQVSNRVFGGDIPVGGVAVAARAREPCGAILGHPWTVRKCWKIFVNVQVGYEVLLGRSCSTFQRQLLFARVEKIVRL